MKDDTVIEPIGGIVGATNLFTVAPADFAITAIERTDSSANPAATTPAGTVFVAAGAAFHVTVEARDSEVEELAASDNPTTGVRPRHYTDGELESLLNGFDVCERKVYAEGVRAFSMRKTRAR